MLSEISKLSEKKFFYVFFLFTVWLSCEYIMLGPYSYMRHHDEAFFVIPQYILLAREFLSHGQSYWYPYQACGFDRIASGWEYSSFTFTLFTLFPGWLAYQFFILLQYFISGYFTFRLCRDHLKLSEISSIYAGFLYALGGGLLIRLMGFNIFPFLLWSLEIIYTMKRKLLYIYIIILSLIFSLFSSISTTTPYVITAAFVWFVFFRRKFSARLIFLFFIFLFVTLLWNYSTIWSSLLHIGQSHRADWDMSIYLNKSVTETGKKYLLETLHTFLSLKLFIFLSLTGFIFFRFKSKQYFVLLSLLLTFLFGGAILEILKLNYGEYAGPFKGFSFGRFAFSANFLSILCSAFVLDHIIYKWSHRKEKSFMPTIWRRLFVGVLFAIIFFMTCNLKIKNIYEWIMWGNYKSHFESESLERLRRETENAQTPPFRVATIHASAIDPSYANSYGFETVDGVVNLYPKSYQRFWSKVIEPVTKMSVRRFRKFNYYGSHIYLHDVDEMYQEAKKDSVQFRKYYNLNLLSLANTKYIISPLLLKNDENLSFFQPDNGVYKENWMKLPKIDKGLYNLKYNFFGKPFYIYENKSVFPRFFVVSNVISFKDSEQLLNEMAKADLEILRNTIYLEGKYSDRLITKNLSHRKSSITVEEYTPDRIKLSIDMDGDGILIVSNGYNQFWKCKINDIDADIFPAYATFWGVYIKEQTKDVLFYYDPPYSF